MSVIEVFSYTNLLDHSTNKISRWRQTMNILILYYSKSGNTKKLAEVTHVAQSPYIP